MSDMIDNLNAFVKKMEGSKPSKKLYAEQLAEYLKIIQKPKKVSKAKKPKATVKALYGAFGVPAEYLDGKEMKPMKLEKGVYKKPLTKKQKEAYENIGANNKSLYAKYKELYPEFSDAEKEQHANSVTALSVTSTCYVTEQWQQGTPSGSAGTTDFGGWGVSSTNSPVSMWKKAANEVLKQQLLMDLTVIALQTRVKELEQKLAKKELQESDLKEPKKRKRIVEI